MRKKIGIFLVCMLFIGANIILNFNNNCVTASNDGYIAYIIMDDADIDCAGATTYAYLHAEDVAEHVGSCSISLRFDPDEVSIVSTNDYDLDSLFWTVIDDTIYLLGIMDSNSYLTGDFNIARIGFKRVGNTGCNLNIISSELLTDDPMPSLIPHSTIDGYAFIFCNSEPNIPSNPIPASHSINVDINASFLWSCSDPDGDNLTYDIYFGSISNPPLVSQGGTQKFYNPPGEMNYNTQYYWKIVAEDEYGSSTTGPVWDFTTIKANNNPPNKPIKPSGITSGKIKTTHSYTSSTNDPNDDNVYYWFDWGDGTNSGWDGPHNSGDNLTLAHSWTREGSYPIKVKAKDIYGNESIWSDPLVISMPKAKIYNPIVQLILNILQRFPFFEKILNQNYT